MINTESRVAAFAVGAALLSRLGILDEVMVSRLRLKGTARSSHVPGLQSSSPTRMHLAGLSRSMHCQVVRFDHPLWRCACALCPSSPPLSQPRVSSHRSR